MPALARGPQPLPLPWQPRPACLLTVRLYCWLHPVPDCCSPAVNLPPQRLAIAVNITSLQMTLSVPREPASTGPPSSPVRVGWESASVLPSRCGAARACAPPTDRPVAQPRVRIYVAWTAGCGSEAVASLPASEHVFPSRTFFARRFQ